MLPRPFWIWITPSTKQLVTCFVPPRLIRHIPKLGSKEKPAGVNRRASVVVELVGLFPVVPERQIGQPHQQLKIIADHLVVPQAAP
jgi:hypothetical protein